MNDVERYAVRIHYEYCMEFGIAYRPLSAYPNHVFVWWTNVAARAMRNDRRSGGIDASMLFRAWSHDLYVKPWNAQPQDVRDTWIRVATRMSNARERGRNDE